MSEGPEGPVARSTTPFMLPIADGNRSLRAGDNVGAIARYIDALRDLPRFSGSIVSSLLLARQRYRLARAASNRQAVAVCGWELSHKLFPLNYLPYLFEKNAVVVEFI